MKHQLRNILEERKLSMKEDNKTANEKKFLRRELNRKKGKHIHQWNDNPLYNGLHKN